MPFSAESEDMFVPSNWRRNSSVHADMVGSVGTAPEDDYDTDYSITESWE